MPPSRRALLRSTGLAFAGGTLASLAGCTGTPSTGADGPQDSPARTDTRSPCAAVVPATDPTPTDGSEPSAAFTAWLPAPAETPFRDGYGFSYYDVAAICARRSVLHENALEKLERQMLGPVAGRYVNTADITATLAVGDTHVTLGSFDPVAVGRRITHDHHSATISDRTTTTPTQTPLPAPRKHRGFEIYGTEPAYAVSEDAVLWTPFSAADANAAYITEAVIDARAGETDRYADGNAYVAAMLGAVDRPHSLRCYPEAMDGSTSRGFREDIITGRLEAWRFGPETTHLTFGNTYPDAETATREELAGYIERESDRFGVYSGLDVRTDGRLVWTDGTVPTGRFDHLAPGGPEDGVTTPD